ncbi:MAG: Gfo/Idh/MocA family oxidoreductase [Deltaproteobacteria bacterium]|nr:Gfo/Idh/MocA family oxidoreductase [Deltaproteobacteria bacterium]
MKHKTAIIIGAGDRGGIYASYATRYPDQLKIVGVAEPVKERRERIATAHRIPYQNVFSTWEDILSKPVMADGAIIATQDTMHVEPVVRAMEAGYHALLEKPMALTEQGCNAIINASQKTGMTLNVCHVLRYTQFFSKVKELVSDGILGDIYTIYHAENVSYYHMAHSYVRGNWRNSKESSPMILAKCCHDMDLLYWFAESMPRYISSFGGLHNFTPQKAPKGAPKRCTDGCPVADECEYNAIDTYLHGIPIKLGVTKTDSRAASIAVRFIMKFPRLAKLVPVVRDYVDYRGWPVSVITEDLTKEGIMKALREGPYGRCVYHCDNDQVDHQVTTIEFHNGITAMLHMHGLSEQECRTIRIDGSKATLRGKYGGGGQLEVHVHRTGKKIVYPIKTDLIGHSEGDWGIMKNFVKVLNGGKGLTSAIDSLQSHIMCFRAHRACVEKRVVEL